MTLEPTSDAPAAAVRSRGKTFVLTGTLGRMTREEATAAHRAARRTVAGSVSKKTSFVVVGADAGQQGSRRRRRSGSKRLDEAAFCRLIIDES